MDPAAADGLLAQALGERVDLAPVDVARELAQGVVDVGADAAVVEAGAGAC